MKCIDTESRKEKASLGYCMRKEDCKDLAERFEKTNEINVDCFDGAFCNKQSAPNDSGSDGGSGKPIECSIWACNLDEKKDDKEDKDDKGDKDDKDDKDIEGDNCDKGDMGDEGDKGDKDDKGDEGDNGDKTL